MPSLKSTKIINLGYHFIWPDHKFHSIEILLNFNTMLKLASLYMYNYGLKFYICLPDWPLLPAIFGFDSRFFFSKALSSTYSSNISVLNITLWQVFCFQSLNSFLKQLTYTPLNLVPTHLQYQLLSEFLNTNFKLFA